MSVAKMGNEIEIWVSKSTMKEGGFYDFRDN